MERLLLAALISGALAAGSTISQGQSQPLAKEQPDMKSAFSTADFSPLPAVPHGKSTVLGGEIAKVDPVLDQLTLRIFGQHPMKIFFDERTRVYRNGARIPLRDLRPEEHASVQTILDGPDVFAISIHMLSDMPQGEAQGRVLDYNAETRELTLGSSLSRDPIRLLLRADTPVVRHGQGAFTSASGGHEDLVSGALVDVTFDAGEKGRAVASRVTVLAEPGSNFVFSGKISSLDMHAGIMMVVDPRDQKSYQISFDPSRLTITENLHVGDEVRVDAMFDGTRYAATDVVRNELPR